MAASTSPRSYRLSAWNALQAVTAYLAFSSVAKPCSARAAPAAQGDAYQGVARSGPRRNAEAEHLPQSAYYWQEPDIPAANRPPELSIVVSHFDEDLDWLAGHEEQAVVYCKGPHESNHRLAKHWVHLPNIGCESQTYLHHIVENYGHLANYTLFAQGRIQDSVDNFLGLDNLIERTQAAHTEMVVFRDSLRFDEWSTVNHVGKWEWEKSTGLMRPADTSPGEFWAWMFQGAPPPLQISWVHAASFAVHRDAIERHPLSFYRRLLHRFAVINHPKPEEGHFMERYWMSIFGFSQGIKNSQEPGKFWWRSRAHAA